MAEIIVEGTVKCRFEKKWKKRYCVIKKLSPVAGRYKLNEIRLSVRGIE